MTSTSTHVGAGAERVYLVSGVDGSGRRVHELVRAADAGAAGRELEARGLREIWHHMDDEARVSGGRLSGDAAVLEKMGARAVLNLCEAPRPERIGFVIGLAYRALWIVAAPGLVLTAARRAMGWPFGVWDVVGLVLLGLPAAYLWRAGRWLRAQRRLARAVVDGDWAGVLRRGRRLREQFDRLGQTSAGFECASKEAEALTALGKIDEAMATLDARAGSTDEVLILLERASLFGMVERFEEARRCCVAATEAPGAGHLPWCFLARVELGGFGRVKEARAALSRAAEFPVAVKNRHLMQLVEAGILIRESRPGEARALLEEALRWLDPRVSRWPTLGLAAARCRLQLAFALSRLGDRSGAMLEFRRAEALISRRPGYGRGLAEVRRELGLTGPQV